MDAYEQEQADKQMQERVKAAECKGDGVHSNDLRFWHDWRLWSRKRLFRFGAQPGRGSTDPFFTEVWYCTRCRKIEERRG